MGGFGSTRWSWVSTKDTVEFAIARHQQAEQGRLPAAGLFRGLAVDA